ncbi:LLM class flavin-dependent oxidoreductase [Raineyella sp. LH-20]|uniref:LLM class flavin-dependent oxidoreductase n=1 Tax=Raineyella sp. LH-20 TaxID=3081204 RepID=UPI002952F57D|nr:LLM class flavin-dependent oxidoreductase [Raineyella sp. LH-20]WOP19605.1 LLM class flavin-dependent oxidoreductase [Raineyella sp. LH-20]
MTRVPLSLLDLVPVSDGSDVRAALAATYAAVTLAEECGYHRYWFAEHHNSPTFASSATSLLIAHALATTSTLRVGSGGVMLPNHAPLTIAEQYGTLVQLHGDRVDLGLGRAPGTDPMTARMLRRGASDAQSFADQIYELQSWFGSGDSPRGVSAIAAGGTEVPIWVLGSTTNGASIAGQLGLPFAVASHFAPAELYEALSVYRNSFSTDSPTARRETPYAMVGVSVLVADTDEEAEYQYSTHVQMSIGNATGDRRPLQPPRVELPHDAGWRAAQDMLACRAVGSPATVRRQLDELVAATEADELIVVTYAHDPQVRLRSLRLLAELWA